MKNHSMLSEIWRRFKKNKQALVGLIVLILFVLIAIFADQIAPYGYDDQDASRAMIAPCAEHIFGTDNLGRDQLSRLIYGSRYSLAIGFLAVGISVITGGILGVLAAYYPKLDNIIMRCMDLFMAIPQMLLAMCIVTALGSSLFNLMLAVGLSSTPKFARVVRAAVMSTREQEFVEAARAIGANNWRIIVHHILPNSISSLIVQATLAMAGAAGKVIGVEVVPQAVEDARDNAVRNGVTNAEFFCGDAGQAALELEKSGVRPDVVVVDPPRKGLNADTIEALHRMSPRRIVYVSCDPATLARDVALLKERGYTLKTAAAADLFPRCAHVEAIVSLQREI